MSEQRKLRLNKADNDDATGKTELNVRKISA